MVDPTKMPLLAARYRRASDRQRGMSVVYVAPLLLALFVVISMAVDVGRVRTSKAQLSTAVDAAAFAGARMIPVSHNAATAHAVDVAAANHCNGSSVAIIAGQDIQFGLYRITTNTYTPAGGTEPNGNAVSLQECNAIRVNGHRNAARGTAIGLTFAQLVGKEDFDIAATATAFVRGGRRGFGMVGLDWVRLNGTVRSDSYSSEPYDPNNYNQNGSIASNGTITLIGTSDIYGDARPGIDHFVTLIGDAQVHGWTAPLDEPLSYPPASVPAGLANSGDINLTGNDTLTLSSGTYWFSSIRITGNNTLLNIEPSVTIYVTGNIDLGGGGVVNPGTPADLKIFKVGGGDVEISGGSTFKGHVYAPEADVFLGGTQGTFGFFGWVVGRTLDIRGNSALHYDETLEDENLPHRTVLIR